MATEKGPKKEGEKKERKPRQAKPLSPNGLVIEFAKKLSPTQADWFMRHFVKPYFAKIEPIEKPELLDDEIKQAIKKVLETA